VSRIRLYKGDITRLKADAIVNAANSSLLGGGGVDGTIHRAAGPGLLEECIKLKGCPTGEARITKGYRLPAGYVIHTVGPVWHGGQKGEAGLLASCYQKSLALASQYGLKTVAFPNISTGVYGYPKEQAAMVALETVKNYIRTHPEIEEVIFTVFDEENYIIYKELIPE